MIYKDCGVNTMKVIDIENITRVRMEDGKVYERSSWQGDLDYVIVSQYNSVCLEKQESKSVYEAVINFYEEQSLKKIEQAFQQLAQERESYEKE